MMKPIRKIIHIDMDAFYASIEQRDHPELRGKPLIIGGFPDTRGVVATCSYEARKFGIHSAMPSKTAYRLCPQAVFLRPRMNDYKAVSAEIFQIFHTYTDLVEPIAYDEAYLDTTLNTVGESSATLLAREIKQRIFATTALTASAGVSYNKFLAKIASDWRKPDGLTVITPQVAERFLARLPVGKFFGIGHVTEQKLHSLGVYIGADLQTYSEEQLVSLFKERGRTFYLFAHGQDERPVQPDRVPK
jgi:DNA polymerase-4